MTICLYFHSVYIFRCEFEFCLWFLFNSLTLKIRFNIYSSKISLAIFNFHD